MHWDTARPVLLATYRLMSDQTGMTGGSAVCADLRMSEDAAAPIFRALEQTGYIEGHFGASGFPMTITPTEKGLQYCSGWPVPGSETAFVAQLLAAIDTRADELPEPESGRLRRVGEAVGGLGRGVLTEIVTNLIARQTGL